MDKYPSELSGGMKKNSRLSAQFITIQKIVLYDEPTTGLDQLLHASFIN